MFRNVSVFFLFFWHVHVKHRMFYLLLLMARIVFFELDHFPIVISQLNLILMIVIEIYSLIIIYLFKTNFSLSDGILYCMQNDFKCNLFIYFKNIHGKYNNLDQIIILLHIFILYQMNYIHVVSLFDVKNEKTSMQHDLYVREYKTTERQIINNVKYYILMNLISQIKLNYIRFMSINNVYNEKLKDFDSYFDTYHCIVNHDCNVVKNFIFFQFQ